MSFNRTTYDHCKYEKTLKQSTGIGNYHTGQPRQNCYTCIPSDPRINVGLSRIGPIQNNINGSTCKNVHNIDLDSEIIGINSKIGCAESENKFDKCELNTKPECVGLQTVDTRLDNPPSTLKGTGWNRFEWLCKNPQDRVLIPFDHNISYRLVAKDNHRPNIPQPINQAQVLPPLNHSDAPYVSPWMHCQSRKTEEPIPSVHWRNCNTLQQLTNGCYN